VRSSHSRWFPFVVGRHKCALGTHELPLLRCEPSLRARRELLGLARITRHERHRQRTALPELVVVDLGDGGAEAIRELCLRRLDVLALAFERACAGEVQLDCENRDEAGVAAQDSSAGAPAGTGSSSEVRSTSRVS
jgi:hypothetical protein